MNELESKRRSESQLLQDNLKLLNEELQQLEVQRSEAENNLSELRTKKRNLHESLSSMQKEISEVKSLHTSLQESVSIATTRLIQFRMDKDNYLVRKQNLEKLKDQYMIRDNILKENIEEFQSLKSQDINHDKLDERVNDLFQSSIMNTTFFQEIENNSANLIIELKKEWKLKVEHDTSILNNQLNELRHGAQSKFTHLDEERQKELNVLRLKIDNKKQEIILKKKNIELNRQKEIEERQKAAEELERLKIRNDELEAEKKAKILEAANKKKEEELYKLKLERQKEIEERQRAAEELERLKKRNDELEAEKKAKILETANKKKEEDIYKLQQTEVNKKNRFEKDNTIAQGSKSLSQSHSAAKEEKAHNMREAIMKANNETRSNNELSYTSDSDTDSLFKPHDELYREPYHQVMARERERSNVKVTNKNVLLCNGNNSTFPYRSIY